jgi:hypothetical protein
MRTESISDPGVRSHYSCARSGEEEQKRRPSIGALPLTTETLTPP